MIYIIPLLTFIPIVLLYLIKQKRLTNSVFYLYKNKYSYNIKIINNSNNENKRRFFRLKHANCSICTFIACICMIICISCEEIKLKILFAFVMFLYSYSLVPLLFVRILF